ncbi:iron ABC transporter permease [Treponema ruminis]|uniref:Iron(III) transport system permease protein n=1 Tax=Treponema ruminis TaxID=744515 RepID=A0A7W8GAT0_9SPIR|nr:iron ABC transporter permease [Treponema ruminis]MBB5226991.1 iron(III) transport system permease protein [Treponema ruminis]QSI01418.1 iron ABC transporter permease [Treponema ruminis]
MSNNRQPAGGKPPARIKFSSINALYLAVIFLLTAFVVFPLACVLISPRTKDFVSVFTSSVWRGAMLNTLLECLCSTTLSVLVGYLFAYAVIKADIPFKKFFGFIPILHLMTPPFVGGLSFILLFGRQGFFTKTLLGLDVSLYGFRGLLIAQVLCFFPIAYLICAQVLRRVPPSLEQAARAMGASKAKIALTITLPLCANGILSAALFIAVSVLSDFGNPMIVAGRFRVLAVEVYTQLTGWVSAGTSCVLGIILVLPSVALFIAQNHFMKRQNAKFATVGSKSSALPEKKSSLVTRIFLFIFCAFISLLILSQFASILIGAFQKLWGINTAFTTSHFKMMGKYSRELFNSITFAFIAAIFSTLLASLSVFFVNRTSLPCKKYLDICVQIPAAVPGSLFGLALSLASNLLHIHASAFMIIVAMTVAFMPFSYRIISTVFSQIKSTLDDASLSLGANKIQVLSTVLLPLSRGGVFSSFIYDFVRGVGTISSVIFLVSFKTPLASIKILNLAEQGEWGKAAALATVLTTLTFGLLLIGKAVIKFKIKGSR